MKLQILLLSTALAVCVMSVNAQSPTTTFGLRGGVNLHNINGKEMDGDGLNMKVVPRFNIGVVADINVAPDFYFEPGLMFATKGGKSNENFLGIDMTAEYNLSYIELPLNLLYKPKLANGYFMLGFGPYIAYGVGGKAEFTIDGKSSKESIEFTDEYSSINPYGNYFKRLDYGGNLFFGYEMSNGITFQVNCQLGLANINADNTTYPDNETAFRNTGYGIMLGYNF